MGKIVNREEYTDRRKELRQGQTDAERKLWGRLRAHRFFGLKFKRQYSIGPYILDFYCLEKKICIEVDGGQHAENIEYDAKRSEYLSGLGITVIRFWNNEVLKNIDGVMGALSTAVEPSPQPSPISGEGAVIPGLSQNGRDTEMAG